MTKSKVYWSSIPGKFVIGLTGKQPSHSKTTTTAPFTPFWGTDQMLSRKIWNATLSETINHVGCGYPRASTIRAHTALMPFFENNPDFREGVLCGSYKLIIDDSLPLNIIEVGDTIVVHVLDLGLTGNVDPDPVFEEADDEPKKEVKTFYWSRIPGNFVFRLDGKPYKGPTFSAELWLWYATLVAEIDMEANKCAIRPTKVRVHSGTRHLLDSSKSVYGNKLSGRYEIDVDDSIPVNIIELSDPGEVSFKIHVLDLGNMNGVIPDPVFPA